jgi:hypothetical protein
MRKISSVDSTYVRYHLPGSVIISRDPTSILFSCLHAPAYLFDISRPIPPATPIALHLLPTAVAYRLPVIDEGASLTFSLPPLLSVER